MGEGTGEGDPQLAVLLQRIDIFLLENNADSEVLQLSGIHQTVLRISGKTADGFCYDKVYLTSLAVCDHLFELFPFLCICTRDPLICINTGHFIILMLIDIFCIILDLCLKTMELVFLVC